MKLLLDENISSKLVKYIIDDFPNSSHIDYLQMQGTTDTSIWEYAKAEGYIIVSKDNDFRQRSFLFGAPPKVIWLSVGNGRTTIIKETLLLNVAKIHDFAKNNTEGLLVLEQK
ncbi:MAG: DUF5615 family PIN-like protein [Endozoicomonadaceae bacterium]|nr:DUF5615 family PIN-like protein [Endozoicomonadaceae bacterium]